MHNIIMTISQTSLPGVFLLQPKVYSDDRGYFYESYNAAVLANLGIDTVFKQDNQSKSVYGVIRGLHFQLGEFAQTKLIRVQEGAIYDVAVDLRSGSPTFGEFYGVILSAENHLQLYIPKGFAHGFSVLSENAVINYKCDEYYNRDSEGGILYNDPTLGIDWKIPDDKVVVSDKDKILPGFEQIRQENPFQSEKSPGLL